MKLSSDQIITLKKLISVKGYEEIDVQYEILDHVACRVEVLMEENPKLTLDHAFRKVHSEFGIFGFSELADSYRESIRKKFWSRYWSHLITFFTTYRVIYLIILAWILNLLSKNFTFFGEPMTIPGWGVVSLFISIIGLVIYHHRLWRNFKNYATFKQATGFTTGIFLFVQIAFQGTKYLTGNEIPTEFSIQNLAAWLTIAAMAVGWISIFLLPKIIQEAAEETQKLKEIYEA